MFQDLQSNGTWESDPRVNSIRDGRETENRLVGLRKDPPSNLSMLNFTSNHHIDNLQRHLEEGAIRAPKS